VLDTQKEKAKIELDRQLNNRQSYQVTLAMLAAEVEAAQLELNALRAQRADYQDQTDKTVTQAEARLRQAQLAVKRLERQVQDAALHAPFNGIISAVYLHRGEWAQAGAPVVEIIDTGRWRVETKNVSELDIARIKIGQEAIVRVMAFKNEAIKGKVLTISPGAVVQQGDTTYTLVIELEDTRLNLLPGMNAQVEILTDETQ
jgi:HlyD family secretion protein